MTTVPAASPKKLWDLLKDIDSKEVESDIELFRTASKLEILTKNDILWAYRVFLARQHFHRKYLKFAATDDDNDPPKGRLYLLPSEYTEENDRDLMPVLDLEVDVDGNIQLVIGETSETNEMSYKMERIMYDKKLLGRMKIVPAKKEKISVKGKALWFSAYQSVGQGANLKYIFPVRNVVLHDTIIVDGGFGQIGDIDGYEVWDYPCIDSTQVESFVGTKVPNELTFRMGVLASPPPNQLDVQAIGRILRGEYLSDQEGGDKKSRFYIVSQMLDILKRRYPTAWNTKDALTLSMEVKSVLDSMKNIYGEMKDEYPGINQVVPPTPLAPAANVPPPVDLGAPLEINPTQIDSPEKLVVMDVPPVITNELPLPAPNDSAMTELETRPEKVSMVSANIADCEERVKMLLEEKTRLQKELQTQIDNCDAISKELDESKAKLTAATDTSKNLNLEINRLGNELTRAREENARLLSAIRQKEKEMRDQQAVHLMATKDQEKNLASLRINLDNAEKMIEALKEQLAQKDSMAAATKKPSLEIPTAKPSPAPAAPSKTNGVTSSKETLETMLQKWRTASGDKLSKRVIPVQGGSPPVILRFYAEGKKLSSMVRLQMSSNVYNTESDVTERYMILYDYNGPFFPVNEAAHRSRETEEWKRFESTILVPLKGTIEVERAGRVGKPVSNYELDYALDANGDNAAGITLVLRSEDKSALFVLHTRTKVQDHSLVSIDGIIAHFLISGMLGQGLND